ncbi:MAG: efflux RND transporter permease subunit [Nitrospiraceae bacterium]
MILSDLSVRRPVLATVMSLLLVLFGLLSFTRLTLREYPDIAYPIVSVRTVYPGASPALVETDVTTVLEGAISGIEGLRTITSASRAETSQIVLEFGRTRSLDAATNDVRDAISRVRRQLPLAVQDPLVAKETGDGNEIMWLSLASDRHSELEMTDVAERFIKNRLAMLPGVSTIPLDGERRYAMRIWLDPERLAARRLAAQDVEEALRTQNLTLPSGRIESDRTEFDVSIRGSLETPQQFLHLIVAYRDGYPVRIQDIGRVELGSEDDRKLVRVNGKPAIGIGVAKQSKANTLEVAQAVKQAWPDLVASLPEGMTLQVAWDGSLAIEQSIREVYRALGLALILVVLVIYLFLGSVRATFIPAVAIPASIIGAVTILWATGCSLNVLTLLGFVLAVGLVVDDAIIVLENIHRRIESGVPPIQAAMAGSREIGFAVLATTLSLVVVFIPIAFLTGVVGRLFAELAIAVAAAVLLSGFVALTLTPMLCATLLKTGRRQTRLSKVAEEAFAGLVSRYRRAVERLVEARGPVLGVALGAIVASVLLFLRLPMELAPLEDVGWFAGHLTAPEGATIRYTDAYARQVEGIVETVPEVTFNYMVVARGYRPTIVNRASSWVTLAEWEKRDRTQQDIVAELNARLGRLTGVKVSVLNPPPMEQSPEKTPVQFVLVGSTYEELRVQAERLMRKAAAHPGFLNPDMDLSMNMPHVTVEAHRSKSADVGVSMAAIGRTLETFLSGRPVTTFSRDGRVYNVIVKVDEPYRNSPSDIMTLPVRGEQGQLMPLGNVVSVREDATPEALHHYDRMRAVTISAGLAEGFSLGEALDYLNRTAKESLPRMMRFAYAGESKEFLESRASLHVTFGLAILVVYLVLSAQFESFLSPLVILLTVPPAVMGGLLALAFTGGTLNIYSQIGLIILIGLVTKNAILIVEFANQLRGRGMAAREAIVEAATLRFRPIIMTTAATILGALPLALATGAGAAGRRHIGLVLVGGLALSTLLSLFLVPTVYRLPDKLAVARLPYATVADQSHASSASSHIIHGGS